jgi:predicted ester cyclase
MRGCLGKKDSMSEENKDIIRRLYEEVWNQHNPEAADEFVAPDVFTRDMLPEYQHGIDGYKHLVRWLHTAMPDLWTTIENIIAEGDEVATFVTFSGTHTGLLRDLTPTGRQVLVKHTHWYRLANGKVVETWAVRDDLGMMQQMKGESFG